MATRNHARGSLAPATPEPVNGSNPLVQDQPRDTLSAAREVLAFVRDWADRPAGVEDERSERGLSWILTMVDDAVAVAGRQIGGAA